MERSKSTNSVPFIKTVEIPTLYHRSDLLFMLCDVQEKNVELFIKNPEKMITNINILIECASILNIPVIVGEHRPNKFGATHSELQENLKKSESYFFEKSTWSMLTNDVLYKMKKLGKNTVILFGIEAHLCILNTALDLIQNGVNVFIVYDAIRSERDEDLNICLKRFEKLPITPTSVESCIYEILKTSDETFDKCRLVLNRLKEI
jgi:nicotinamidase-related amidase